MTASPADRPFAATRLIPWLAAASLLAAAPVMAQDSRQGTRERIAPRPLAPPTLLAPRQDAPKPDSRAGETSPESPPESPSESPPQSPPLSPAADAPGAAPGGPAEIKVDALQRINPESVGTMTAEEGGLGIDMWEGTDRRLIERLLPKLPVETTSRSMRDLMRRLLLSTATAPLSPEGEKPAVNLVAARIMQLSAMGDVAGMEALLKVAPGRGEQEALLRAEMDLLFLSNDNARACPLVASQVRGNSDSYWQKAFIFCQSLAGEHDKAALGVSVLRDSGESDPIFYGLIDRLAGVDKFRVESLTDPSPLHLAMVRAARARLPRDAISSDDPAILRTIAMSPNARPELRVDAAERAEAMGSLRTDVLRQLYAGITFPEEALDRPLSRAEDERNPMSRALLYRKALVENVPTAVAEVVSRALELGREGGRYQATARTYHEILSDMRPTRDLAWFAPDALRAMIAIGDNQGAGRWLSILESDVNLNEESRGRLDELAPLVRLAGIGSGDPLDDGALERWWRSQLGDAPDAAREEAAAWRAAILFNIMEGLGDHVPAARWVALLDRPPLTTAVMPAPVIWRTLGDAAASGRVGETVLLALLSLGQAGPAETDAVVLRRVVRSLGEVGLMEEARAMALEAAIAAGI